MKRLDGSFQSRYPPPKLPFPVPWNYVPSTPSTLKGIEETVVDILGRFPTLEAGLLDTAADLRKTLASIGQLTTKLGADDGSLNLLLVQLRGATRRVEAALDDAKLDTTTASLRETSGRVARAADDVGDVRHELREALVALRETLESIRTLAETVERDPSILVRGPRADTPPGAPPQR